MTERQKWKLVGRGPSVDGRDWYLWQHQPNEYVPWAFDLWAIPVDEFWVGNEHLVHLLTDAANTAARDLRELLRIPTEPDWFTADDIRAMPLWDNPHLVRRPRLSGRATTGLRRPTRRTVSAGGWCAPSGTVWSSEDWAALLPPAPDWHPNPLFPEEIQVRPHDHLAAYRALIPDSAVTITHTQLL